MKLFDLRQHLESCPVLAGATRTAWEGKARVYLRSAGDFLYIDIDGRGMLYGVTFEDAIADDWEPL